MNKNDFKFLLKLNQDIDHGCQILRVNRDIFLPQLQLIFEAASFGMERSPDQKTEKVAKGKVPKSKSKPETGKTGATERAGLVIAAVEKILAKTESMRLVDIMNHSNVFPLVKDLKKPLSSVWTTLNDSTTIVKVKDKTGFYKLKK